MPTGRKSYILGTFIGLAAAAIALGLCSRTARSSLPGQLLWRMELASYDFRLGNSAPNTLSDKIMIVTIDEESMAELGTWPWPRSYHAQVVRRLADAGAKTIGLDMILSTVSNPEATQEAMENKPLEWEPPPGKDDLILEKAFKDTGIAVLAATMSESSFLHGKSKGEITEAQFPYWRFEDVARAIGVVNIPKDIDGSIRRCWVGMTYQDERYFTMPLMLAALYQNSDPGKLADDVMSSAGVNGPSSSDFLISYRGRPSAGFPEIPYYQILRKELSPDLARQVKGKIVLIGATANALQDRYYTPTSIGMRGSGPRRAAQMPGVEIMANAIDTILNRNFLRPAGTMGVAALLLILCLPVSVVVVRLRPLGALAGAWLTGQVAALLLSLALWQWLRLWVPLVALSMGVTLSYVGTTIYLELTTERQRRSLQQSWAKRVSPEVLQVILNTPGLTQVRVKRLVATVLFTDLQDFTTFCHDYPPEQVVNVLNDCLTMITSIIRKHGGTVHKFIGDGVLAVFGDPVPQLEHARRAVAAACELQQEMAALRMKYGKNQWIPHMRIGIHTGELVAGDIGSRELLEYTVIGDTVSTASRLEALNKEFDTEIMISKTTHEAAGSGFKYKPLGLAQIRGLSDTLEVYAVEPGKESTDE